MSSSSSSVLSATSPSLLSSASSSKRSSPPPLGKQVIGVPPSERQWKLHQSSSSSTASSTSSVVKATLSPPPSPSRTLSSEFFGNSSSSLSSSTVGGLRSHKPASSYVEATRSSPPSPARATSAGFFLSNTSSSLSSSTAGRQHSDKSASSSSSLIEDRSTSPVKGNQAPPSPRSFRDSFSNLLGFLRRGSNPKPEMNVPRNEDPGIGPLVASDKEKEGDEDESPRPERVRRKPSEPQLYLSSVLAVSGSNQVENQTANPEDDFKRGGPIGRSSATSRMTSIEVDEEPGADSIEIQFSPRSGGDSLASLDVASWSEDEFVVLRELYEDPDKKCSAAVICSLRDQNLLGPNGRVTCLDENGLREYYKKKLETLIQNTDIKDQKFVKEALLRGCRDPHYKWVTEPLLAVRAPQKQIDLERDLIASSLINKETKQVINPKIVYSVLKNATFQKKK